MRGGISIDLGRLDTVDVAADGRTARIGGGAKSKKVIDVLAAAGKQTGTSDDLPPRARRVLTPDAVTGACECVGFTGPALGGGHGWLQGRYGLAADQIVSMDVVLADGSLRTIYQGSGLMWAMKGAGHNFGIVTSVVANIYDVAEHDWAVEVFVFTGDKVEAIYEAANGLGADGSPIVHWSYWLNDAAVDPLKASSRPSRMEEASLTAAARRRLLPDPGRRAIHRHSGFPRLRPDRPGVGEAQPRQLQRPRQVDWRGRGLAAVPEVGAGQPALPHLSRRL